MFNDIYLNKKVLITGNTGFKGTWLSAWLLQLGAEVIGISDSVPTNPSFFEDSDIQSKIKYYQEDICDLTKIKSIIDDERPDFIFHLAAQAIVSESYLDPVKTINTNVVGTTNLLEIARLNKRKCIYIFITSDKAYDNVEQIWGYKENDQMGGKDVYSGSKGAAELIIKSYYNSFLQASDYAKIGIARAGNVIGGGDWAKDRIVVDSIKAWSRNDKATIRNPFATRPWQHVLEPLSGYLNLGQALTLSDELNGHAFNFGPKANQIHTVEELILSLSEYWKFIDISNVYEIKSNNNFYEANLLKLNCDKALFYLKWQAVLDYEQTTKFTGEWYYHNHLGKDIMEKTNSQITEYCKIASNHNLPWTE